MEVLADDYAAKGDEELIEVKIGDDLIFIEKKYIKLGSSALEKPVEPGETPKPSAKTEMLDEDEEEDFNFDMEDDLVFNDEEDDDDDDDDDDDEEESHKKMHDEHNDIKQSIEDLNQEVGYLTNAIAASTEPKADLEMLSAKLKKSLSELESIKADMSNTFTSTDTISSTIQNLRGMLDALKKDQMDILSKQ